jgi:hypothetical protein
LKAVFLQHLFRLRGLQIQGGFYHRFTVEYLAQFGTMLRRRCRRRGKNCNSMPA